MYSRHLSGVHVTSLHGFCILLLYMTINIIIIIIIIIVRLEDSQFKESLINYLRESGGSSIKIAVRNCVNKILAHSMQMKTTRFGVPASSKRVGKMSFQKWEPIVVGKYYAIYIYKLYTFLSSLLCHLFFSSCCTTNEYQWVR